MSSYDGAMRSEQRGGAKRSAKKSSSKESKPSSGGGLMSKLFGGWGAAKQPKPEETKITPEMKMAMEALNQKE